ncbi:MAG TPA: tetratricopeptide repeat protein, partial [Polyangia bacterium]
PSEPIAAPQPVAAPIPPAPQPTPPTVLAAAAPARPHKKHEPHVAVAAVAPHAAAAPAAAAAPPPPEAARPTATAPKTPFAEGEALFRSGDVEAALARYQEAARANPSDARAQKMIGKCYNRLGQHDRAVPYLKRYLELSPDASDKQFIQAQIDQK